MCEKLWTLPKCQKSGCDFLRNQRRKSNSTSGRNLKIMRICACVSARPDYLWVLSIFKTHHKQTPAAFLLPSSQMLIPQKLPKFSRPGEELSINMLN
jgi:hypothetical protein